jgi:hypothetical protein
MYYVSFLGGGMRTIHLGNNLKLKNKTEMLLNCYLAYCDRRLSVAGFLNLGNSVGKRKV